MKLLSILGLICDIILMILSILTNDFTEMIAWIILTIYHIKEIIEN